MKKLVKISFLLVAMITMATTAMEAQKFGYVNSALILSEMPEVKQADANLETLQKQLQKKYEKMVTDFQTKYQDLAKQQEEGKLSPKQIEEEGAKLRSEEEKIAKFEKETQQQLIDKRQELLKPIYDKVNEAIKQVATEGGYQMIFDQSTSVILFADDTSNLNDVVKAKIKG